MELILKEKISELQRPVMQCHNVCIDLIFTITTNCISDGCRSLVDCGVQDIYVSAMGDSESAAEGSFLGTWKFQEYKKIRDPIPKISLFEDTERFEKCLWYNGIVIQ